MSMALDVNSLNVSKKLESISDNPNSFSHFSLISPIIGMSFSPCSVKFNTK